MSKLIFFGVEGEKGWSMPIVLTLVLAMAILSLGISDYVIYNLMAGEASKEHAKALSIAEAGIDDATWQLETQQALPPNEYTHVTGEGTATVSTTRLATSVWQITSRAQTQGGGKAGIQVTALSYAAWDAAFSKGLRIRSRWGWGRRRGLRLGQQSSKFIGYGNFYFSGGVTLRNGSQIYEGPLFIKGGDLAFADSYCQVGSVSQPILAFIDGSYPTTNFYYSTLSADVPDMQMPTLDNLNSIRGRADLVIDNDNRTDRDTNVSITQWRSFSRSSATGKFIWDSTNQTLTIDGVVFIDGRLTLGERGDRPAQITYAGNGIIVLNGRAEINTRLVPRGGLSRSNVMLLVTNRTIAIQVMSRDYSYGYTPPTRANLNYSRNVDVGAALFGQTSIEFRSRRNRWVTNPKTTLVGSFVTSILDFGRTERPVTYYIFVDSLTSTYLNSEDLNKVFIEVFPAKVILLSNWREIHY